MAGGANQSTVVLFSASGQRFASPPPVPRGAPLVSVAPVPAPAPALAVPASRAAVTALPVPVLLVPLLFILVELPLELVEVRHAEAAASGPVQRSPRLAARPLRPLRLLPPLASATSGRRRRWTASYLIKPRQPAPPRLRPSPRPTPASPAPEPGSEARRLFPDGRPRRLPKTPEARAWPASRVSVTFRKSAPRRTAVFAGPRVPRRRALSAGSAPPNNSNRPSLSLCRSAALLRRPRPSNRPLPTTFPRVSALARGFGSFRRVRSRLLPYRRASAPPVAASGSPSLTEAASALSGGASAPSGGGNRKGREDGGEVGPGPGSREGGGVRALGTWLSRWERGRKEGPTLRSA